MVLHALRQPDSPEKSRLLEALGQGETIDAGVLTRSLEALDALGSIQYARSKAEEFHQLAHACLNRLEDGPAMVALRELTDFQLARLH